MPVLRSAPTVITRMLHMPAHRMATTGLIGSPVACSSAPALGSTLTLGSTASTRMGILATGGLDDPASTAGLGSLVDPASLDGPALLGVRAWFAVEVPFAVVQSAAEASVAQRLVVAGFTAEEPFAVEGPTVVEALTVVAPMAAATGKPSLSQ